MRKPTNKIVQELKDLGYLQYNGIIEVQLLEKLLDMNREHPNFMGSVIRIRKVIEKEGYFCCGRNCGGGFRILAFGEMPRRSKRFKQRQRVLEERRFLVMSNANMNGATEREIRMHTHELNKIVNDLSNNVSLLRKYLK